MLIEWFLSIKSLPNLLFGVLCLPGDQSHPVAQPTINPLARCICWAGLLGRAVFPPWNEGPNFGSYSCCFLLQCMKVRSESEVAQLCPTRSDPMDYSPPGSSVDGIFQARVLEWGAIAFSEYPTY